MNSLIRPRLFAAAALLLVLGGASYWLGTANAEPSKPTPAATAQKQAGRLVPPPSGTGSTTSCSARRAAPSRPPWSSS